MSPPTTRPTHRRSQPWYKNGLRFECVAGCAACCTNHGSYSYVYLETRDIVAMAGCLGISVAVFRRRYTVLDDGYRILRMDEPDCPFLEGSRCSVYSARPQQCRTFPFWPETLGSPKNWKKLEDFCPGINQGPRHTLTEIRDSIHRSSDAVTAQDAPATDPTKP